MSTTIEIKHHFEDTNYYLAIVNGEINDGDKIKIEHPWWRRGKFHYQDIYGFVSYSSDNCAEKNSRICCIFKCKEKLDEGKSYSVEPESSKKNIKTKDPVKTGTTHIIKSDVPAAPLAELERKLKNFDKNKSDAENKRIEKIIDKISTSEELIQAWLLLKKDYGQSSYHTGYIFKKILHNADLPCQKIVELYKDKSCKIKKDSAEQVLKDLVEFLIERTENSGLDISDYFDIISSEKIKAKDMYAGLLAFLYFNGNKIVSKEKINNLSEKWGGYIEQIENGQSNEEIFFEFSMLANYFQRTSILIKKFPEIVVRNFEQGNALKKIADMYKKYPDNRKKIAASFENISSDLNGESQDNAKKLADFFRKPVYSFNRVELAKIDDILTSFENIENNEDLNKFEANNINLLPDAGLNKLLEDISDKISNGGNEFRFRAAAELAIAAEKKNNDCIENARKIYSQCKKQVKYADILFICAIASDEMSIKNAAIKYCKVAADGLIKKNLEWIALSDAEQEDEEKIDKYKNDSAEAQCKLAVFEERDGNLENAIYAYFQAALKGQPEAIEKYKSYLNAAEGSKEREAYQLFVETHPGEFEDNDGTLKKALWMDKALAWFKYSSCLFPLSPALEMLASRSVQELEKLYNSASGQDKGKRYYKTVAALAGEKYLMAYYAQKECGSQENYRRFIKSVDSKVLFSKSAKWPDELPVSENPADKASDLLSVLWDDYIKDEKLINTAIPEKYKHFLFYYALLCFLRNGELNKCAERIINTLIPFPPASYLSALNKIENGSKNAMEELWKEDDVSGEIKCMAAFCLAKHFYEERSGLNDEYKEIYFNSLFKNRYYSYNSAKNINGFFDEIKKKIKEDKDRITDLPLFKEHLLPNEIINRIEEL